MPDQPFDPIATRHSLLNRLKDWGDQASWQEFFDIYWQLIYNVAAKAGLSDVEAQEVVQETIIAVARKIGEFKAGPEHGSFSGWLMQLTRWRICDQQRRRKRDGHAPWLSSDGETPAAPADDTDSTGPLERLPDPAASVLATVWQEEWEQHLMRAALERVKRRVSPRQFQMFDLHVLQNQPVKTTARMLQASVASVYMAKHRIARLLKKEIREVERTGR